MADFPPLAFTRFPLDRADRLRGNADALTALRTREDAVVLAFWRHKPFLMKHGGGLAPARLRGDMLDPSASAVEVFLGLEGEAGVFAAELDPAREPGESFPLHGLGEFEDLRLSAGGLDADDAALLATARGLFAWHARHGFCSNCGAATALAQAGWRRTCPACEVEHFPRVDPVVIMLIVHEHPEHGERVLLGRGEGWPERGYSCLAGFVEPGETLGDAARREAREEAGVILGEVSYLLSQPWPFPSSLMFGVEARAGGDAIELDPNELADARWVTKAEMADVMAERHPDIRKPYAAAIATRLMSIWLARGD
jgi:NAD+ diphosphatase